MVVALVEAVQWTVAPRAAQARADVVTGTAGLFVPVQGRIMDSRNGNGGYSTPMVANQWRSLPVAGAAGIPATGVSAVAVTLTVLTPASTGIASVGASSAAPVTALLYGSESATNQSGSAISAVASDGTIQVRTNTAVDLLVDVQGYFTAGNGTPAPGGYVPVAPTRVVNTTTGVGWPHARLANASTNTITIGGTAGVPGDASAVFVTLTPISYSSGSPFLTAFPAGTTRPATSLNFAANQTSAIGATVDLNAAGQMSVYVGGASAAVDLTIDVVGYYTATSTDGSGAFTPAATRVYDSRNAPNAAIASGATATISVGGLAGVPLPGAGISSVAINLETVNYDHGSGYLRIWAADQPEPTTTSMINLAGVGAFRSDFQIVRLAADGRVKIRNATSQSVHVVIDAEGWFSTVGRPVTNGQTRTQQYLNLQAGSAGGGSWVTYKYRTDTTATFTIVPPTDAGSTAWPVSKTGGVFPVNTWNMTSTLNAAAGGSAPDTLAQVQACYGTSATDANPVCSVPSNIDYVRSSFGASYSTSDVGPGSVSLLTGNYQISASDVSVPSYRGSLSIGRTFTTTTVAAGERSDATGIFGPGWSASLPGTDAGAADLAVTDNSAQGYLTFTDTDGSISIYQATSDLASYPIRLTGVDDAAADGATVSKDSATQISMLDSDGTATVWQKNTSGVWGASSVTEPATASATSYTRDTAGRVTRILGAIPTGVTCTAPDSTPGCRSLTLSYTTGSPSRLQAVTFHSYDPATSAMAAVEVAHYDYDANNRLSDEYDPRITPNLKTTYTYDGAGRLAGTTPPGLAAWTLAYDATGRLATASRYDAALAQTAVTTLAYGSGMTGSPIDLSKTTAATWAQTDDLPLTFTAIFGPDRQPASTNPSSITSTDWPYATLSYLDVNGRETNTASYGAGTWQYGATSYDSNGNTTINLTAGNRAQALTPTSETDSAAAAATTTAARAALLSSITSYDPLNPDRVIDTYGPVHPIRLASGTSVHARSHDHTNYDQGAPLDANGDPITPGLPTTVTSGAWDIATSADAATDVVTTTTGYSATAIGGSKTGWDLRAATSSSTLGAGPGGADLTTNTRYNDAGQVVQSWLPGSTGADARSTSTVYYTAGTGGTCLATALAGLTCSTGPTAQPVTGNPLPVATTNYNLYDQSTLVTETAGSTVRTSTTSYDAGGRTLTSTIAVTPTAAGGSALPATTTAYNSATGLPTTLTNGSLTLTTGYDTLGRVTSYTDATGNNNATGYDLSGNPISVNDGKATTGYTYDSTSEHRGLVTSEDLGVGAAPGTMTATYDPDGNLKTQTYPNGLIATTTYDNTGNRTSLGYVKGGSTWMSFTATSGVGDRTVAQTSPQSSQSFGYDPAGRLVTVQDTYSSACTTRGYGFDADSNRTSLTSYPAGTGGACSTSTTPAVTNSTFDQADRLTSTGYTYDTLGRSTTVPAADAHGIASHSTITGDLTVGYYSNDMVASQTQGAASIAYSLDPLQNRIATTTDGPATTTSHYSGDDDSPDWTSTASGWTRNSTGIDGNLAATQDQTGTVTLQLTDLHGDIIATAADDVSATTIATYSESTEYGAPRTATNAYNDYGWLGGKQRSTNSLAGLTLMGVRLYNPATGRFLTTDPIPGGNVNTYTYPLDPINDLDLSGLCRGFWGCTNSGFWHVNNFFSARGWIDGGWHAAHHRYRAAGNSWSGAAPAGGANVAAATASGGGRHRSNWTGSFKRAARSNRLHVFGRVFAWPVTGVSTFLDYGHSSIRRNGRTQRHLRIEFGGGYNCHCGSRHGA